MKNRINIRKISFFIILVCLLLSLGGCQFADAFSKSKETGAKESSFGSKVIGVVHSFLKSYTDEATEYINIVFEAASKNDEDTIYNLFSEEIKEELGEEALRGQVKDLIQFYKGTEIQSTAGVIEENTDNEYGVNRIRIEVCYGIETDNGDYEFKFEYIARSDTNPEEAGFETIQIATRKVWDDPEFHWGAAAENHGIVIFE